MRDGTRDGVRWRIISWDALGLLSSPSSDLLLAHIQQYGVGCEGS